MKRLHRVLGIASSVMCLMLPYMRASAAEDTVGTFPRKPVHLIVPSAPGAGADYIARLVADKLSKLWGQPVVVENKPGASSVIGTTAVVRSQADGYTLLFTWTALIQSAVQKTRPPYDVFVDLAPVCEVARSSFVLMATSSLPANDAKELVALAKQRPGGLSYGSYGTGTSSHILAELFKQTTGINMLHVPYKGGGPLLADLQAGHVPVGFFDFASARTAAGNGRLKLLAITSSERSPYFKSTPTFSELGIQGLDLEGWFGILAPRKTDARLVQKIGQDAAKAIRDPDVMRKLEDLGVTVVASGPEAFEAKLRRDEAKWRKIITQASIQAE